MYHLSTEHKEKIKKIIGEVRESIDIIEKELIT